MEHIIGLQQFALEVSHWGIYLKNRILGNFNRFSLEGFRLGTTKLHYITQERELD